ncbi:hypothetical protein [Mesorhizobium sp. B1-1-5]|uniref:hypothetical protein n=1 Tax=Mesorhizobium sp. B1-1-5 TaxID=2589979 RepID=UPI00112EB788|nr:hypothetical protein [Mesorhizobium sp. B1-1-5]TPO01473.1 hypothetical protein FJ980_20695 [Mesorhizobium sp. B1-1-5]
MTGWQREAKAFRRIDHWRENASANGIDGEVRLLIEKFARKAGANARSLCRMLIIDALARAAKMKD